MEVVSGDSWSYKTCEAPVRSSPRKQHPVYCRLDALPVAQPTVSNHWMGNLNTVCVHLLQKIWMHFSLFVLTAIFQVDLGYPVFIEAKDDGGGGDNLSYKSCKAPVKLSPPTNQHPVFLQARCPSYRPTNSLKALKGRDMDAFGSNYLGGYSIDVGQCHLDSEKREAFNICTVVNKTSSCRTKVTIGIGRKWYAVTSNHFQLHCYLFLPVGIQHIVDTQTVHV